MSAKNFGQEPPDGELIGSIAAFSGSSLPSGWLSCDGSAVSRDTYSALFDVIGTTYGSGDGADTFNLPNLSGRVVVGSGTGTDVNSNSKTFSVGDSSGEYTHKLIIAEMPSHNHTFGSWYSANGADGYPCGVSGGSYGTSAMDMQNTGGNGYHNNVQPYTSMTYAIYTGIVGRHCWIRQS